METAEIAFYLVSIIISSSGISCNILMAAASYRIWVTDGFSNPRDLIIFYIGLCSALFQSFYISLYVSYLVWADMLSTYNVCTIIINVVFAIFICTVSLTSWLCSFYCIKLVSFQHRIILFLKTGLPTMIPWIIGGTLGMCGLLLVLLLGVIFMSVPLDNTYNSTSYCTRVSDEYNSNVLDIVYRAYFLIIFPFLLILISLGCTLAPLIIHIRRVQRSPSLDNSHLKAHITAAKTMILLLVLNVAFFTSQVLWNEVWLSMSSPLYWIYGMFYVSFWKLQALTLIFRNKKLRVTCQSFLLNCFKKKM
ncbi:taste receptor type 2 member 41-like [Pseudophryne corroboree]|uniref:taste receptor type 2 member 41-like n=1 Tax=Pseudophryne corroboree TaxID=495146 RepID=UPI00308188CF